jgi:hypothetical protein
MFLLNFNDTLHYYIYIVLLTHSYYRVLCLTNRAAENNTLHKKKEAKAIKVAPVMTMSAIVKTTPEIGIVAMVRSASQK